MMHAAVQLNKYTLWAASIAGSLLLQMLLAHFLWQVCISYDRRTQPKIMAININPTPPPAKPLAPVTITEKPLIFEPESPTNKPQISEPITEKPLLPISELPAIKPEAPPEALKTEPSKPATKILKPETSKPPAPPKIKAKVKPDRPPLKKTTIVFKEIPENQQTHSVTQIPVARPTIVKSESSATGQPKVNAITEPGELAAATPVLPQKDFSSYLQKIYRIIEKNKRYPTDARKRGLHGKVLVSFSINSEGKATDATAQDTVAPELQQATLKLLLGQKFPQPPPDWNTRSRINMTINYSIR
ncbi:MAG TPA: TonB family protein [Candidatus Rifleibacterium sp.]|nr:TonB family protein [Candidatus Rifleibacterium sp.]HPT44946.1 TonB family protein [Candidatus Rifleibacterium sp.]